MPVLTAATIILYIIRTTEIVNIFISGIHMIPQLMPAFGTDEKITEDAFASVFSQRLTAFAIAYKLLYLFIGVTVNNRLVNILKNLPTFFRVDKPCLVLEVLE